MIRLGLPLLLLLASPPVEKLLLQARHAEEVRGDYDAARRLYRKALDDKSLDTTRQAEIRLRIANCYAELGDDGQALDYLAPTIYDKPGVAASTRNEANRLRYELRARMPQARPPTPPAVDIEQQKRQRVAEHLAEARRHLARNRLMHAYAAAQKALELAPDNPDVRALDGQIRTRLSGVAAVLETPLDFLRDWSEAQVKSVAVDARRHMHAALRAYRDGRFSAGEREFREAIALIDGCEFADASTELLDLRETVRERWRAERERIHGPEKAEPEIAPRAVRSTPAADYLRQLQRMLDVLSSPEYEYRLLPVSPHARGSSPRSQRKPTGMVLERDVTATRWTLARFASAHLRRRVDPDTWLQSGNFLDTSGDMLVARNRRDVLDRLQAALVELEKPATASVPVEFLLVSVPTPMLDRFAAKFGAWQASSRETDPVLYRVLPASVPFASILAWLNEGDQRVEVRADRHSFATVLANGRGESLLAGRPLRDAHGYEELNLRGAVPIRRLYGVLLDVVPWRDRDGRGAVGLRITVRQPAPPVDGVARFLTQTGELYADLGAGGTLVATGMVDPFAAARAEPIDGTSLMLLWRFDAEQREPEETARGVDFEFVVRPLLYDVHLDDPGPYRDPARGFVPTDRLDAVGERARFLETRLRALIAGHAIELDWEEAVLRVPKTAATETRHALDALEKESRRRYVVEVESRVVPTSAFQRWMERAGLELHPMEEAQLAMMTAEEARAVLRQLPSTSDPDSLAPAGRYAVLGNQARHLRATRTRTAPAIATEEDLERGATQTVTEGVVISVRPYLENGRNILADVRIETAGLEELQEERALGGDVPAFRARVNGVRAARNALDFGTRTKPKSALICRVPHPTRSRPESLTELVISIRVTHADDS